MHERRFTDAYLGGLVSRIVTESNLEESQGVLYFGSQRGSVWAVSAENAGKLWRVALDGPIGVTPAAAGGRLFLGTNDGKILALSAKDGSRLWEREVPGEPMGRPALYAGSLLLVGVNDGSLYALDAQTGAVRWRRGSDVPDRITVRAFAAPAMSTGRVFAGFSDGTVVALRAEDGGEIWRRALAGDERFPDIVHLALVGETRLIASHFFGRLHSVSPEDGRVEWSMDMGGSAAAPRVLGGELIVPRGDSRISAVDLKSGTVRWTFDAGRAADWSGLTVYGDRVFATTFEDDLYVVALDDGRALWRYRLGAPVQGAPIVYRGCVWMLTRKGTLFCLRDRAE